MIQLVIALRITRDRNKKEIVDVKVLVFKKYLVLPCRKVAGTRRELSYL
jgi:hypothetical protein